MKKNKNVFTKKDGKISSLKSKLTKLNNDSKWNPIKYMVKLYDVTLIAFSSFMKKARNKPLLIKIIFTLLVILLYRVGASITMPGITVDPRFAAETDSLTGIMNLMSGGTLKNFSIIALGIGPYITASIVMQLLQSPAFPPLYRLSRSGPAGKRKINIITRWITLFFGYLQAVTVAQSLGEFIHFSGSINNTIFKFLLLPTILIAGSLFVLFLAEQITNKGIGNGTSLIIFSGVAVLMPSKISSAWSELVTSSGSQSTSFLGIINFLLYALLLVFLLFVIGYFYKSERHVPIQQTGSGMTVDVKQMSKLPIKLNPAGVMPVIIALTLATLPLLIANFMDRQSIYRHWMQDNMKLTQPIGLGIFVGTLFLFTTAMSIMTFNPMRIAEQFSKNGTFIPGVRPGNETEEYLTGVVVRLSIFSAIYLSIVCSIPYIEQSIGLSRNITFSGVSLIILVSVAIETIDQLRARDKTSKIAKAKAKSSLKLNANNSNNTKGLLW